MYLTTKINKFINKNFKLIVRYSDFFIIYIIDCLFKNLPFHDYENLI